MTTQENIKPLVDRILNNPVQFRRANGNMQKHADDSDKSSYIVIGKSNNMSVHYKHNENADETLKEAKKQNGYEKKRKIPSSVAEALNWYTKAALGEAKKKKKIGSDDVMDKSNGEREDEMEIENAGKQTSHESQHTSDSSDSDVFHEANEYVEDVTMSEGNNGEDLGEDIGRDLGEDIGEDVGEEVTFDSDKTQSHNTNEEGNDKGEQEEKITETNTNASNLVNVVNGQPESTKKVKRGVKKELLQLQKDNQKYEREQEMIREIRRVREEQRKLAEAEGKKPVVKKRNIEDVVSEDEEDEDSTSNAEVAGQKMSDEENEKDDDYDESNDENMDEDEVNNEDDNESKTKIKSKKLEKPAKEIKLEKPSKIEEGKPELKTENQSLVKKEIKEKYEAKNEEEQEESVSQDDKKSVTPPTMIADISEFYQLNEEFEDKGCIENSCIRKNWGPKYINKKPKGLLNHGVTCYTNAAVQALLHIPAVQHYLNEVYRSKQPNVGPGTVTHCFAETSQRIWGHDGKKNSFINPRKLITRLEDINCMMSAWQQEDSHEYFMSLMSRLQEDSVPKGHKMTESMIYDIFGGLLKQTVTCNSCGEVSTTEQPFYDLSLHLKGKKANDENEDENSEKTESKSPRYSIEKSIRDFFHAELIRVDKEKKGYVCEKCHKTTNAVKQNCILRAPETLLVHLKKFRFNGTSSSKMKQAVSFPMFLDLTEYCDRSGKILPVKYQLLSVVVHEGRSLSSGHYIAHCRQPDGSWATYDDEYINKITEREVLKERNAYYVIYTRLTPKSVQLTKTEVSKQSASIKSATSSKNHINNRNKNSNGNGNANTDHSRNKKKNRGQSNKKLMNKHKKRKYNK